MVGALNKLPVAASGLIFFGDPVTFGSVSAILVGFIAGLVYTVAKKAAAAAKSELGNVTFRYCMKEVERTMVSLQKLAEWK